MNQRQIGALILAIGGVMVFVGGVLSLTSGSGDGSVAGPATTATAATTTTSEGTATTTTTAEPTEATTTTTPATTTTAAETTTTTTATTTTAEPTTTTISPTAQVESFIAEFATALESGDVEFVFSRLHPAIVLGFGEELCRAWVEREIMALSNYTFVGPVTGPSTGSLETPTGNAVFEERYTVDITFSFSGAEFSTAADYVLLDGVVYFTGTCR